MSPIRLRSDDEAWQLLVAVLDVLAIGIEQYEVGRFAANHFAVDGSTFDVFDGN